MCRTGRIALLLAICHLSKASLVKIVLVHCFVLCEDEAITFYLSFVYLIFLKIVQPFTSVCSLSTDCFPLLFLLDRPMKVFFQGETWVTFTGESQLQLSHVTRPTI